MKRPSWNDAPEWAKYLTANEGDGYSWFWWENEPEYYDQYGEWFTKGNCEEADFFNGEISRRQSIESYQERVK